MHGNSNLYIGLFGLFVLVVLLSQVDSNPNQLWDFDVKNILYSLIYLLLYAIRIGFVEGVWMVGVIDEIRMPETEANRNPILVETKTRAQARSPAEPQQRNGRYAHSYGFYFNFVDMRNC